MLGDLERVTSHLWVAPGHQGAVKVKDCSRVQGSAQCLHTRAPRQCWPSLLSFFLLPCPYWLRFSAASQWLPCCVDRASVKRQENSRPPPPARHTSLGGYYRTYRWFYQARKALLGNKHASESQERHPVQWPHHGATHPAGVSRAGRAHQPTLTTAKSP